MEELLNRLAKVDANATCLDGGVVFRQGETIFFFPLNTHFDAWGIAGWCLEKMQAVWKDGTESEIDPIVSLMDGRVSQLTPEKILTAYCDMVEARG